MKWSRAHARVFDEMKITDDDLILITDADKDSVRRWRIKGATPAVSSRRSIARKFKFPMAWWKVQMESTSIDVAEDAASDVKYPAPPASNDPIELLEHQLACIRIDLANGDMVAIDRSRTRSDEVRAIKTLETLRTDRELTQDLFIRQHPAWVAMTRKILDALRPHKRASEDVLEALRK